MPELLANKELQQYEKIPTRVFADSDEPSKIAADEIAGLIRSRQEDGRNAVLGLSVGPSTKPVFKELVRMHKEDGLSLANVITFNLQEYFPIDPEQIQSYNRAMNEVFFSQVDIKKENIHIPDGTLDRDDVFEYCQEFERKIQEAGGLDIQLVGVGRTGHVGYNEPGSSRESRTRLVTLDKVTRIDAASVFFEEKNVPRNGITMGIGTLLEARKVIVMAFGAGKGPIIRRTVEGDVSEAVPASFLQDHPNTTFYLDKAASSELTRFRNPWLVGSVDWDDRMIRSGVVWLCQKVDKPILKLTDEDYTENGLGELVTERGPAYSINIKIFNEVQHTITGWPGGKPNADDSNRPERAEPFPKRVVLFSPHPDDDVISMGGTLLRLIDQGHEVHVAYQTSGNIAVLDEDAVRFADFVRVYAKEFDLKGEEAEKIFRKIQKFLKTKKPGDVDIHELRQIKGLVRQAEARAAAHFCGLPDEQIHFMHMPFYETGQVEKMPLGEEDVKITKKLLDEVRPHQIYAAGDLADPHGTHKVCLDAVMEAVRRSLDERWYRDCYVWLYRGAWHEWDIDQIEMAVPISPDELHRKRRAIFKHQSQKDNVAFPGSDKREFWQRAEDRNRGTAEVYDKLGMAEYEAIEAFVRWIPGEKEII